MLNMTATGAMYRESERRSHITISITCFWALIFVLGSYHNVADAATTQNRNAQTSGRGSSVGENTSSKSRKMEPAFANAGSVEGLEIWRIEDFKPVAYPKKDYGKLYSGDSYIILNTINNRGILNWNLHFWLGSQTSQDEAGAAAILTVQLDDQLGGDPVQHREVQDHESQLFLSYFKSGVRYLPGGVSSGFTHVDRNAFEKKLYHVKGKRNIRIKQVDTSIAAMNRGDCFILDVGESIFVYVGAKSKTIERLKAISAANEIRDQDHGGRPKINIIDAFSTEGEIGAFFNALGSGSAADVPEESAGGDDQQFETTEERNVILYRVSDSTGKMEIQPIGQKPLGQNQLDTKDCFVLDTTAANLYVWIGKQCNKKEKDEAMSRAQEFIASKHYPAWTHVERVVEGGEPSIFRQYFQTWQGTGELHPRQKRSAAAKPTKLADKSGGEVPEFMPDNGSGELQIFRIEHFDLAPVDAENYGKFFGGDSYVIKYRAKNGKWIIYIWQGTSSSLDEKAASAIQAIQMDNELGGKAVQIRVAQDYEPKHFLHIFKGKLIVFLGGHASGFKNIKDHDTYVRGETRMYRIRGTSDEDVRASQQVLSAKSLQSDDVFIVENDNNAWIWIGKDSDEVERDLANGFLERLAPGTIATVVQEGEEPAEFWTAIGGQKTYSKSFKENTPSMNESRLYHAHVQNGKVTYEQIYNYDQSDLDEDDVMVLDSTEEVYVWIGKGSTEEERKEVLKNVFQLLKSNNRHNAVVITVKQGDETELFTSMFSSWDPALQTGSPAYQLAKQRLAVDNK